MISAAKPPLSPTCSTGPHERSEPAHHLRASLVNIVATEPNSVARSGRAQRQPEQQAAQLGRSSSNLAGRSSPQRQALRNRADLCQLQLPHRLPRLRQLRHNRVHCFLGSGPQLHPLEVPRRPEADLRLRRKLNIVVPDQSSFGSMSIRTSTISLEHAITVIRKAALTCARRRLRVPAIAQR
jgi:hypothetical protein